MATTNNYEVHHETDANGITYRLLIEQDLTPVRGNALASGDDMADKAAEDEIIKRLDSGDTWAWAGVECEASFEGFISSEYLGNCSYENTQSFIAPGGYWDDMKYEAAKSLKAQLLNASLAWRKLSGAE